MRDGRAEVQADGEGTSLPARLREDQRTCFAPECYNINECGTARDAFGCRDGPRLVVRSLLDRVEKVSSRNIREGAKLGPVKLLSRRDPGCYRKHARY